MKVLGQHILAELYECNSNILDNADLIKTFMEEAAKRSNATIVNSAFHHFSPQGVSGVVVIKESHLAVHTWPEYGYAAVDLFTCGPCVEPDKAFAVLKNRFEAAQIETKKIKRGIPDPEKKSDTQIQHKPHTTLREVKTSKKEYPCENRPSRNH